MTEVEYIDKGSANTIVAFTGVNHGFGFRGFRREFAKLSDLDSNVLFVVDKSQSWYNNLDVQKVKGFLHGKSVCTIGNSMGGFCAIMFALDHPVRRSIAFSTQYSIHPDFEERRWLYLAKRIKTWRHKHLLFNNETEYYVFSGKEHIEARHINKIPNQGNIKKVMLPGGHEIAGTLKNKGVLYPTITEIIKGNGLKGLKL